MAVSNKGLVKLVCSYGGKLKACPISDKLIYCGGDSRLIIVNPNIKFDELLRKLSSECGGICVGLKYQLPGEDPNVLVSLTNGDDLENMMFEYDKNAKTKRIRLFLDMKKTTRSKSYLFGFDNQQALEEWMIPRDRKPMIKVADQIGTPC